MLATSWEGTTGRAFLRASAGVLGCETSDVFFFASDCCITASAGRSVGSALLLLLESDVGCTGKATGADGFGVKAEGEKLGALAFRLWLMGGNGGFLKLKDGEGGNEIGGVGKAGSLLPNRPACIGIFSDVRGEIDFSLRRDMDGFLVICLFALVISTCDE